MLHPLLWLAACETATESLVPFEGTIFAGEVSGEVVGSVGYAATQSNRIAVAIFPKEGVTCDQAGDELGVGDEDWDPSTVQESGKCSLSLTADWDEEAGISLSGASILNDSNATLSISCAMGEGSWEYREGDRTTPGGYFFTGEWWQGNPESFDLELSGSESEGWTMQASMDTYSGQFIYDLDNIDKDPGTGAVSGGMLLEPCDDVGVML